MKIEGACHPVISECPFNHITYNILILSFSLTGNNLHGLSSGGGYGNLNSPGMYGDPMGHHQTMGMMPPSSHGHPPHPPGPDGHSLMDLSHTQQTSKHMMDPSNMSGGNHHNIEPLTPEESDGGIAVQ